jgi:hypothetical protein
MLVLAAAAAAEQRTPRVDPLRRRREDLDEVGFGEILVVAKNPDAHRSPGSVKGTMTTQPVEGGASASGGAGGGGSNWTRPRPEPRFVRVLISSSISW